MEIFNSLWSWEGVGHPVHPGKLLLEQGSEFPVGEAHAVSKLDGGTAPQAHLLLPTYLLAH